MTKRPRPESDDDDDTESPRPAKHPHVDAPSLLCALLPELRTHLYDREITRAADRAALARTCRLFYDDLCGPRYLGLPTEWRQHLASYGGQALAPHVDLVEAHLRPARLFERVPNLDDIICFPFGCPELPHGPRLPVHAPTKDNVAAFVAAAILAGKDARLERVLRQYNPAYANVFHNLHMAMDGVQHALHCIVSAMGWHRGDPSERLQLLVKELGHQITGMAAKVAVIGVVRADLVASLSAADLDDRHSPHETCAGGRV